MPECLLWAYVDRLPRLQAERLREQSFVSAFPHMGKQGARDWLAALAKTAAAVVKDGFTWNGREVSAKGLRARLSNALGGGFSQ